MWNDLKRDFLVFALAHNDRFVSRFLFALPDISLSLRNLYLFYSTSIFDMFRFPNVIGKNQTIVNGLVNFPFVGTKTYSLDISLSDTATQGQLPQTFLVSSQANQSQSQSKVSVSFSTLVVDQYLEVLKGTSIETLSPADAKEEILRVANKYGVQTPTVFHLLLNNIRGEFPRLKVPPVVISFDGVPYIIKPLIVYSYEYNPRSISSSDSTLFNFPASKINPAQLTKFSLFTAEATQALKSLMPVFNTLGIGGEAFKEGKNFQVFCSFENIDKVAKDVQNVVQTLVRVFPSPELLYNIKFGKIWNGSEYPSASISVSGEIVGFIAIKASLSNEEIQKLWELTSSSYMSEDQIARWLNEGKILLLSEIVPNKQKYIEIAKRVIYREIILPKYFSEFVKMLAPRFVGLLRLEDHNAVHLQLISEFAMSFNDSLFNGFPVSFNITFRGSDISYGVIREVPQLSHSLLGHILRTLEADVQTSRGEIASRPLQKFVDSMWFDGINVDSVTSVLGKVVDISDLVEVSENERGILV